MKTKNEQEGEKIFVVQTTLLIGISEALRVVLFALLRTGKF